MEGKIHETLCIYSPKQKGFCKIRMDLIMDKAGEIVIQAQCPKNYGLKLIVIN